MIKVLHILPSLGKGGAERLVLDICQELQKNPEFDVKIITFKSRNLYKDLASNINYEVCNANFIPSILGKSTIDIENYKNLLSTFQPHIIHSHLFKAEIVSRQLIYPNIAYITHLHDNMRQFQRLTLKSFFKKTKMTNYYEKKLLIRKYRECKNNFISISNDTDSYFKSCLPQDIQRITLIHNAINFEKFYNPEEKSIKKNNVINLISVGSLFDKKNQMFLVDVIKILKDKGYNVMLDILGDGVNREKIQKKIDSYKLKDTIFMRGNVDNVEEYLKKSCIFLHAATYEPFGLVLLEAMAMGLPCVTLDGKGNRDIIRDYENGFIIANQNPQVYADIVIQLIENPKLYHKMSTYCKEFSRQYDIKNYILKLSEYYKGLIGLKST